MSFFQNTCKPDGLGGKLMVKMMNYGHRELSKWGFAQLDLRDNVQILDAGCGGGANVALWLKKCPHSCVTGIDYSAVSVNESQKLNESAIKAHRCEILQASVAQLPFPDAQFFYVSAFETIYFWPDLVSCFREINRVLQAGGIFFICNESDGTDSRDEKWTKKINGMRIYSEEEIYTALKTAGFHNIKSSREKKKRWLCLSAQK